MIFSAAAVLSVATTALATLHVGANQGHSKHSPKLYAWADLTHPSSGVSGKIEFWGTMDGEPTYIKWSKLKGLNKAVSPAFGYHIHTNPVGPGGDCAKTLAHLDPLGVSPSTTCNPGFPQYCEEGDLSGKHGKLNATDNGKIAAFGYSDDFVRFYPQSHSILGRSVVIHAANTTRIACGNIISVLDGTADESRKPTGKPSKYVTEYATAAPVAPTPVMIWSNGTTMPDEAAIAALPRYLPIPALRLNEAKNVKLVNITHKVKFANSEQEVTQLKEEKVDEWDGKFSDECED